VKLHGFYFITDHSLTRNGIMDDSEKALEAGCRIIQYRRKEAGTKELLEESLRLKSLCSGRALFIVNDRLDIALASDADGVHIGQDDMPYTEARKILGPEKTIGVTVHNTTEAVKAAAAGADYLGVSPIYATSTKEDAGAPSGPGLLRDIRSRIEIPLAAIGGINLSNAREVLSAGADLVCAISDVICSDDVFSAVREYQELFGL
jgi:thiamine-phosphate pyrophosphorylase